MQYLKILIACHLLVFGFDNQAFTSVSSDSDIAERKRLQGNLDSGRFDLASVNKGLIVAAGLDEKLALDVFLGQPKGKLRPDQQGIRAALWVMVNFDRGERIKWLLNLPDLEMQPDRVAIIGAYHEAVDKSRPQAIAILEPLVPSNERRKNYWLKSMLACL